MEDVRLLITGGSGFIGSHLISYLPENISVANVDINQLDFKKKNLVEFEGDISNRKFIESVIMDFKPTHVVHLAAKSSVISCKKNLSETFKTNVLGTQLLCELCSNQVYTKQFIFISSSMVLGNFNSYIVDESHPRNPVNFYGKTKHFGEILVNDYFSHVYANFIILRLMAVYGPGDKKQRVISKIIRNLIQGKDTYICACDNKIAFTFIDDVIEILYRLIFKSRNINNILHFAYDNCWSLSEISGYIKEIIKKDNIYNNEIDCQCVKRGKFDTDLAKSTTGYVAKTDILGGIKKTILEDFPDYFESLNTNVYMAN